MGTSYSIKYFAPQTVELAPQEIKTGVEERLAVINKLMSTYDPDSEISRFNSFPVKQWFPINPSTAKVISKALTICEESNGAFDITVSNLVELWGFGPSFRRDQVPDETAIQSELDKVGCQHVQLKRNPDALLKQKGFTVDLSAIAKGYAVDQLSAYLDTQGIKSYLVEIGGEIRAKGRKPGNRNWRIAIESPQANQRAVHRVLPLPDIAVATSGDYRNYFEQDGVRFSHTIDPQTGYPIKHKLASVTVFAKETMVADALATAFMVMGPDKTIAYTEQKAIAVLLIVKDNGVFVEQASSKFKEVFK